MAGLRAAAVAGFRAGTVAGACAIGWLAEAAGREIPAGATVLVTLSGRGDKDAPQVAELLGEALQ